jgi:flagellar biosynthesis/type III secretory pathway chaperone
MKPNWKDIADHLRQELADYGGLLHLYAQQQLNLFGRKPDAVLQLSTEIQCQVVRVADSRERREKAVSEFAISRGKPANTKLRDLLLVIESDARPLLEALIGEINLLLFRVRRTHRQNHLLLSKAVAMHRETLQMLRPSSFTKTYSPTGMVSVSTGRTPSTLCAAG